MGSQEQQTIDLVSQKMFQTLPDKKKTKKFNDIASVF